MPPVEARDLQNPLPRLLSLGGRMVVRNSFWLVSGRVIRLGGLFLTSLLLARSMGPSAFGNLSFAVSCALFMPVFMAGAEALVVQRVTRDPAQVRDVLGSLTILKLGASAISLLILLSVLLAAGGMDREVVVSVLIVCAAATALSVDGIEWAFQARMEVFWPVAIRTAALGLSSIGMVVAALLDARLEIIALMAALEPMAIALGLLAAGEKYFGTLDWRLSSAEMLGLLRTGWPLMLAGVAVTVSVKGDIILLGLLATSEDVGTYATAARISEAWYVVPYSVMTAAYPALIRLRDSDRAAFDRRMQQFYNAAVWVCIPVALVVSLGASTLINLLYGEAYSGSASVLAIHIWAAPFAFFGPMIGRTITLEGWLGLALWRQLVGAAVNVVLNLILIPRYGVEGAAVATLVSYAMTSYLLSFTDARTRPAAFQMTRAFLAPLRVFVRATTN